MLLIGLLKAQRERVTRTVAFAGAGELSAEAYPPGQGGDYGDYGDGYVDVVIPEGTRPFKVEIDWDKNGQQDIDNDVTDLVRAGVSPISVNYGRDQSSAMAPSVSGQGQFSLDNRDRRFSPRNYDSPLYGRVKPARPVTITRSIGGSTYTLFRGYTDDSPINPDVNSRTVSVSLVDALAVLRGQTISTELHRGLRTGEVIHLILDACGWPAGLRDIDSGATLIPWWWEDGTNALEAIEKVVRSEGPPALFTVGSEGEVVFRDRHHRLTRTNALTSQSTWRGVEGVEPVMTTPFSYDEAWRNIINTASVSVDRRAPQSRQVVWTSDAAVSLNPGEQQLITVVGSDPFYDAVPPVEDTDYTMLKGSISVALLRDSGASVTMVLTAVGGASIVDGLQLRARPVTVVSATQVSVSDAVSVADYGPRSFPGDLPWCGAGDAYAVLSSVVTQRAQPLPIVTARFMVGKNYARGTAVLPCDLSERVTVVESETFLNDDFFIESIAHDLTGEEDHSVTFGLEFAPTISALVARADLTGADEGVAGNGMDDPALLARTDDTTPGHRVDEGLTAT